MSRRHRPNRKNSNPAWPLIALGSVLLVAAVFLFTRAPGGGDGGTPRVSVDQMKVDYGYVKLGETRVIDIAVTNTGDGVLRFKENPYIEVLQGCCPPELTVGATALAPGESTRIRSQPFMMHEGMDGPHNFGVHLVTNDPQQPDLVVNLLSDWGP